MTDAPQLSHLDIIALWPTPTDLARDLRIIQAPAVRHWKRTGHIPPNRFDLVIEAAKKRGFKGVTYPVLAAGAPRHGHTPSA